MFNIQLKEKEKQERRKLTYIPAMYIWDMKNCLCFFLSVPIPWQKKGWPERASFRYCIQFCISSHSFSGKSKRHVVNNDTFNGGAICETKCKEMISLIQGIKLAQSYDERNSLISLQTQSHKTQADRGPAKSKIAHAGDIYIYMYMARYRIIEPYSTAFIHTEFCTGVLAVFKIFLHLLCTWNVKATGEQRSKRYRESERGSCLNTLLHST